MQVYFLLMWSYDGLNSFLIFAFKLDNPFNVRFTRELNRRM